jgi:hypothetical protein
MTDFGPIGNQVRFDLNGTTAEESSDWIREGKEMEKVPPNNWGDLLTGALLTRHEKSNPAEHRVQILHL